MQRKVNIVGDKLVSEIAVKDVKIKKNELAGWQNSMLEQHGWYVHYVFIDEHTVDSHTHGLIDNFNHPELQIIFPLPETTVHKIFSRIINNIREGAKYKENNYVEGIIDNYKIKFIKSPDENTYDVLRIIVPDVSGNLDVGTLVPPFHLQYGKSSTIKIIH